MHELSAQLNSAQQQATHLLLGVMRAARSTVLESGGGSAGKALSAVCAEGLEIVRAYSAWRSEIGRRRSFERRFLDDAARHVLRSANSYSRTVQTVCSSLLRLPQPAVACLLLTLLLNSAINCRVCEAQRSTLRDEAARRAQFSGEYAHILPRVLQLGMDQALPDVIVYGHDFVSALPLVECCDGAECDSARESVGAEIDRALAAARARDGKPDRVVVCCECKKSVAYIGEWEMTSPSRLAQSDLASVSTNRDVNDINLLPVQSVGVSVGSRAAVALDHDVPRQFACDDEHDESSTETASLHRDHSAVYASAAELEEFRTILSHREAKVRHGLTILHRPTTVCCTVCCTVLHGLHHRWLDALGSSAFSGRPRKTINGFTNLARPWMCLTGTRPIASGSR